MSSHRPSRRAAAKKVDYALFGDGEETDSPDPIIESILANHMVEFGSENVEDEIVDVVASGSSGGALLDDDFSPNPALMPSRPPRTVLPPASPVRKSTNIAKSSSSTSKAIVIDLASDDEDDSAAIAVEESEMKEIHHQNVNDVDAGDNLQDTSTRRKRKEKSKPEIKEEILKIDEMDESFHDESEALEQEEEEEEEEEERPKKRIKAATQIRSSEQRVTEPITPQKRPEKVFNTVAVAVAPQVPVPAVAAPPSVAQISSEKKPIHTRTLSTVYVRNDSESDWNFVTGLTQSVTRPRIGLCRPTTSLHSQLKKK
jgi:hypothetical protein